ncbi:MAG: glycosyltransferase family 4 protein [Gemmatimonadota bacterium]
MRILMLTYEFPPLGGGGAGVAYGLSTQLVGMGHEVDVVTMRYRDLPHLEQIEGVRVHRVACVRLRENYCTMGEQATYLARALPYAFRLVRKRRFDVNHTHFILPDGLLSMILHRLTGLPYLVTSHGSDVPGYNPHRFLRAHRLLAPVWRAIVEDAGEVICPSESLRSLVLRAKADTRTAVIPNGINSDRFRATDAKEKRILVVTRMLERKGVQFFLRALEGLELEHDVDIVGDGPYLEALEALAGELRLDVSFRGWLDRASEELTRLYEKAQIYVFPSEAENFPIVLLEAMSAGAAIITTKGTGCAEVVGDTALLVEPRNTLAIREALTQLMSDPELCGRLGRSARARVEEKFGWLAVTRQYLDHYSEHARMT